MKKYLVVSVCALAAAFSAGSARAASYSYDATTDFTNLSSGEVPYYVHGAENALAINAANASYRGKFAKAQLTFNGTAGTYDIAITALRELDGECSYRLSVNGVLIGERQNGTTATDYNPQDHVFKNVTVPAGALIEVESNTHSNGQIPENDGFAWARGRWTTLKLETPPAVSVSGELKRWHKVTLTLDGPTASEVASTFTDYRMNVEFTHRDSGKSYLVPGYFAADGNAANTSASSGNKWRAHLAPDLIGEWDYEIKFRTGSNVAVDLGEWAGSALFPYNATTGSFFVAETDKSADDFRFKGRLVYDGSRYLKHAATGGAFIKTGADAPENFLNYKDFDNTYTHAGTDYRRDWAAHMADWQSGDPTWGADKGKGMIGAINYLASEGQNVFSFLTYNAGGDSKDVWPFVSHDDPYVYDCSKLDQWEIVFDHGQNKGMYLHFKLQERENDDLSGPGSAFALDDGNTGTERKLYLRELVARFGHHLALNWNLGEENSQSTSQQMDMFQYIADLDPYNNHRVLHTYPNEWEDVYRPLLGSNSEMLGVSLQCRYDQVHSRTIQWINESKNAGKPWVVANDEQGPSDKANPPDSVSQTNPSQEQMRENAVWGNLMAGGAGVELYAGYQNPHSDLNLTDFRSRDRMWDYCRFAKQFFYDHLMFSEMWNMNGKIGNSGNSNSKYAFGKTNSKYAIYLASGGSTTIDLTDATGTFEVWWFDPRNGGELQRGTVTQVNGGGSPSVGNAPNNTGQDWAVLLCRAGEEYIGEGNVSIIPAVNAGQDTFIHLPNDSIMLNGIATDQDGTIVSYLWTQESGPNTADLYGAETADLTVSNLVEGIYEFSLTAIDNDGGEGSDSIQVVVLDPNNTVDPTADAGTDKTIQLPVNSVVINGLAGDDSLFSVEWTQTSGPSSAVLSGADTAALTASGLIEGIYIFQMKVTDIEGNTASDAVQVTVFPLGEEGAWIEQGGVVVVEAEHGDLVSDWVARPSTYTSDPTMAGSLGSGWLEWTGAQYSGNTKTEAQVNAVITYKIKINTAGDYIFRCRQKQYNDVASFDAGNDSFIALASGTTPAGKTDFTNFTKSWVQSKPSWSWITSFEPVHGTHVKNDNVQRHYEPGIHTVKIAARSPGHAIDRFVLVKTTVGFNESAMNAAVESPREGGGPLVEAGPDQIIYVPESTATLEGSAVPMEETALTGFEWNQISGPNTAVMSSYTSATQDLSGLIEGTYVFELTAFDSETNSGTDRVTIDVVDARFPNIITTSLPNGEVNSAYDQTIQTQYGQEPFTWEIISGTLPPGLTFSNGRIFGTPLLDATYTFTVEVTDVDGDSRSQAYALVIDEESFEETKEFTVLHDAYIQGTAPFNTSELKIEAGNRVAYFMFDVSGITDDVLSAKLALRCAGDAGSGTIRLYSGSHNNWTETTLTDANKPGTVAEVGNQNGSYATGTTYEFEVKDLLDGVGDGTYTLIAQMDSGGNDAWFSSKEGAVAPKLIVTYNLAGGGSTPRPADIIFEDDFSNAAYSNTLTGADWNPKREELTDQQDLLTGNGQYAVLDTSVATRNYHAPISHGFALTEEGDKAVIRSDFRYYHEAGGAITNVLNKAAFGLLLGVSSNWWENGGDAFTMCNRGAAMGNNGNGESNIWVEGWVPHSEFGVDTVAGGFSDWFTIELSVERGVSNYVRYADILIDGAVKYSTVTQELSHIPNGETIYAGYTTGWQGSTNSVASFSKIAEVNMDNFRVEFIPANAAPWFISDPVDGGTVAAESAYTASLTNYTFESEGEIMTFDLSGPVWLSWTTNGALSGVPAIEDMGTNVFDVTVWDESGNTNNAMLQIVVTDPNPPLPLTTLWEEDFDSVSAGTSSGVNEALPGAEFYTANGITAEVVTAPAEFTTASGNAVRLSTLENLWGGVEQSASAISLSGYNIQPGDTFSLTFDVYIPSNLTAGVGGVFLRWRDDASGNGPFDWSQEATAAGVHHFEYTGTFPMNYGAGDFIPTEVWPIIYFHQDGAVADGHAFMDNILLTIGPGAVPDSGFGEYENEVGLVGGREGDDDGDGESNFAEFVFGGDATNNAVTAVKPYLQLDGDGNARYIAQERIDRDAAGLVYTVEWCDNLVSNIWNTMTVDTVVTNDIPESDVMEELEHHFRVGEGSAEGRYIRLRAEESAE
ncbi:DUF5060 domain-containing protein [Verrucomicrobia bacterium S94]|nr:DUF5060 domain-containing protein [Verrucomicrobia bacterium S94]